MTAEVGRPKQARRMVFAGMSRRRRLIAWGIGVTGGGLALTYLVLLVVALTSGSGPGASWLTVLPHRRPHRPHVKAVGPAHQSLKPSQVPPRIVAPAHPSPLTPPTPHPVRSPRRRKPVTHHPVVSPRPTKPAPTATAAVTPSHTPIHSL